MGTKWAGGVYRQKMMTTVIGVPVIAIKREHQAGGDDNGDQRSPTADRLENDQKGAKLSPSVSPSLVAIAAMARVGAGLKMSASMRESYLGGRPHRGWLVGAKNNLKVAAAVKN